MAAAPKPDKPLMPVEMAVRLREILERRWAEMQQERARQVAEREGKGDGNGHRGA